MLQAIFAIVLLLLIALPIPLLLITEKRQQRKAMTSLLQEFSRIGGLHGLSFSSQEVFSHSVIGLDGLQRKLLVLRREAHGAYKSAVIDLHSLRSCQVVKQYRSIAGSEAGQSVEQLESISLVFDVPAFSVPEAVFYNHTEDNARLAAERENRALHWQVMLTKLHTPAWKAA